MEQYPKRVWVLNQALVELAYVDGRKIETIKEDSMMLLAGTFDEQVAEKLLAMLKEHQGADYQTMVRSDIKPLPKKILDVLDNNTSDSATPLLNDLVNSL